MKFLPIASAGCLLTASSFAELPELFVPVSNSKRASAEVNSPYFLPKEIVTVNVRVVLTAEKIRISLFDDQSVVLAVVSVDVHLEGRSIGWNGRLVEPGVSMADLEGGRLSQDEAKGLLPDLNSVGIFAAKISFDERSRLKYQYNFARFDEFRDPDRPALYDVVFPPAERCLVRNL